MKFHDIHNDPVTINANLAGAKKIYQELQQDQNERESRAMEIKAGSITIQLRIINIYPSVRTYHTSQVSNNFLLNKIHMHGV